MGNISNFMSFILFLLFISSLSITITKANSASWLNHGGDLYNRRYAASETKISPLTASRLQLKWKFYAGKDISATPAIYKGKVLYFPSWNGYLYAVKAKDGSLIWKQNLKDLTGINPSGAVFFVNTTFARATPTIAGEGGEILIIGIVGPAYVIAVKRSTGELIWATKLDSHPAAVITMSGTYYGGAFYIGVSSLEEGATIDACCTFRGSFVKLDVHNGSILWKTYMLPDNQGKTGSYAGAAIWGSSPSIDVVRNHVYIGTGNLYSTPLSTQQCQQQENNQTIPNGLDTCIGPDIHSESVLALDLISGEIKWSTQLGGYDVWFYACNDPSTPNCPVGPNHDADFGEAPMLLNIPINGIEKDVVTIVQKSGVAWTLDRQNGNIIWSTVAGPGGISGGGIWGAASDGRVIYTNIANSGKKVFNLQPSNGTTTGGGWVAMDARSGNIKWSTAVPNNATTNPVTLANGVVFAGSTYPTGPVYAIDATNGNILWSNETGATVYGGMSVSNGCIFVGHGYNAFINPTFTSGIYLFAFCVT